MTGESGFVSRLGQEISLQIGSGAHPDSYPKGASVLSLGGKVAGV
jgi:hypothetical protein